MDSNTIILWADLHWKHMSLHKCFLGWWADKSKAMGLKSMGYWFNRQKASAFNKWTEFAAQIAESKRVAKLALMRWIKAITL